MQITQGHCLIHALELACEFRPERKWCRELSKESCDVFDTRTRVVVWNNCAPGLTVESLLKELLEEVPHSLKRLDYQLEIEYLWHWHTTTIEFELSASVSPLLLFLGGTCKTKVTTK